MILKNSSSPRCVSLNASENFFLETVVIFKDPFVDRKRYRLLVMHRGIVETDRTYDSLRNAKIGFFQTYKWKRLDPSIKLSWHPLY